MCLVRNTLAPFYFLILVEVMNKGLIIFAVGGG